MFLVDSPNGLVNKKQLCKLMKQIQPDGSFI